MGNTSENAFLEPWNHGNPPTITSHEQVTALGFGWITGKVLTGDPAFGGPETYKASHDGPRGPCRASAWFSISKIISDQMDRSQPWVAHFWYMLEILKMLDSLEMLDFFAILEILDHGSMLFLLLQSNFTYAGARWVRRAWGRWARGECIK